MISVFSFFCSSCRFQLRINIIRKIFVKLSAKYTCSQLSGCTRNFDQSNGKLLRSPQLSAYAPFSNLRLDLLTLIAKTKECKTGTVFILKTTYIVNQWNFDKNHEIIHPDDHNGHQSFEEEVNAQEEKIHANRQD